MDRTAFTGGPAYLTWNGLTLQMEDDWTAESEIVTVPQRTNLQGKIGDREEWSLTRIKCRPLAFSTGLAGVLAKLWPYDPGDIGTRIFPGTDLPAVIQTKGGRSITYAAAALYTPPPLRFAPNRPLFGDMELLCLRKNNTAATETDAHVVDASSAYSQPNLDPLDIVSSAYSLAFGSDSPLNAIETDEEGIAAELKVEFEDRKTARDGLLNAQIKNVELIVKFTPENIDSEAFNDSLLVTDGTTAGRGKLLSGRGKQLTITGVAPGAPILTIPLAAAPTGSLRFSGQSRVGEVTLQAQRKATAGVLQDLYAFTIAS